MLAYTPISAMFAVWLLWGVSWLAASLWAERTVARPAASEWRYRIFTFMGWALLLGQIFTRDGHVITAGPFGILWSPRWTLPPVVGWSFVALLIAGFVFAWWARLHLGQLWSAALTRKADHRIVDSGPYAIVRHPIYTGMFIGAIATVAIRANLAAAIGFFVFVFGYWLKARAEEVFLSAELGGERYAAYRARVPMLVPFGPK